MYQNIKNSEVGGVVLHIRQMCMSICNIKHPDWAETVRGELTFFSCVCLTASQIFTLMEPSVVIVRKFTKSIGLS